MNEANLEQGTVDLLNAITTYAQECRRAYRCRTEAEPQQTPLNPFAYARLERIVASGSAPAWLVAEWERGAFVRIDVEERWQ